MQVLKCEGFHADFIEIENTLEALQEAVGGSIETMTLIPGKAVMIVNEEGILHGMTICAAASFVANTRIVGTAIVAGVDGEDFTDIDPEIAHQLITKEIKQQTPREKLIEGLRTVIDALEEWEG